MMKTSDFDYELPPDFIAQTPIEPRDHSRLMVLRRAEGELEHRRFFEVVDYLQAGDLLVCNQSRVIPARLLGRKMGSGGKVEVLLLRRLEPGLWETLSRPARRLGVGARIEIGVEGKGSGLGGLPSEGNAHVAVTSVVGEVLEVGEGGVRVIRFSDESALETLGAVPLPPYIHLPLEDTERYQTVYAQVKGSVAAPTAGLHFTPELMSRIQEKGVAFAFLTLHVGWDSFRPVRVEDPRLHQMHREYGELSAEVAGQLNEARARGRRIICVGTTTVRLLEQAAMTSRDCPVAPFSGWAELLILEGHRFNLVDGLITNFHLPRSTLLMLVSAFAGRELILHAYRQAIAKGYRFYSFGDAMLIL